MSTLKAHLRFDGSDGSKVIVDDAPRAPVVGTPKLWTVRGGAPALAAGSQQSGQTALNAPGNGNYIGREDAADLWIADQNATIEFWLRLDVTGDDSIAVLQHLGSTLLSHYFRRIIPAEHTGTNPANFWEWLWNFNNGSGTRVWTASQITDVLNPGWHHYAFVRDGAILKLFIDGWLEGIQSIPGGAVHDNAESPFLLGNLGTSETGNLWFDEFRYSVGIARYGAGITDSQVCPHYGDGIGNVRALLLFDGTNGSTTIYDASILHKNWAVIGDSTLDTSDKIHGMSSLKCPGTNSGVSIADSADFTLGSSDFTFELFFKCTAPHTAGIHKGLFAQSDAIAVNSAYHILRNEADDKIGGSFYQGGGSVNLTSTSVFTDVINPGWHHLAIVRNGSTLTLYIDGVAEDSESITGSINDSALAVSVANAVGFSWVGWIDCFRLSIGVARYTANFSPWWAQGVYPARSFFPPACVGYDQYTKALLHFEGAPDGTPGTVGSTEFIDSAPSQPFWLVNYSAFLDSSEKKFGPTSLGCDGNGFVSLPACDDIVLGDDDFCIECWFKVGDNLFRALCGQMPVAGYPVTDYSWSLIRAGNYMAFGYYIGSSFFSLNSATQFTTTINPGWHHIAVTRQGGTLRMFIDGDLENSLAISGAFNSSMQPLSVGTAGHWRIDWLGWVDDFRLYIGEPKYTAPFTIESAYVWPPDLPQCPILNGFVEQRQRNVVPFVPDVGPPKLRLRSTAAAVKTACAFRMTNAQVIRFDEFYEVMLKDGTLPFTWHHPITGLPYSWIFSPEDAPQKERIAPGVQRVSFMLIRLP